MPARRPALMTMAAPMSSAARTLMASSTLCSGLTDTTRRGFALSSSATVFIFVPPCAMVGRSPSHVRVVRAAAAFGDDPYDVLRRVLDVAGLAVHAVRGVHLKPRARAPAHEFIHSSRTVARLGSGVNRQVHFDGNAGILECQVRRLVLFVVGVRDEHGREAAQSEHAVGLLLFELGGTVPWQWLTAVCLRVLPRPPCP